MEKILAGDQLYQHDPLLVLLRDRLCLSDGVLVSGIALLTGGVLLGGPALVGAWLGWPGVLVVLIYVLVLLPLGFAIYLMLPGAISGLFTSLGITGIISERRHPASDESYEDFLGKLADWSNNRWLVVGSLVFVELYWFDRPVWMVPGDIQGQVDVVAHWAYPWLRVGLMFAYSPVLYGVVLSVARLIIALVFTARLFRSFSIQISPLHPDGSAGLGGFGRMLTGGVLIAATIGAAAGAISVVFVYVHLKPLAYAEIWTLGAIYVIFTPLFLIFWLWLPHRAMVEARDRMLQPLANAFLRSIPPALSEGGSDLATIKAGTDQLAELRRRYDLLKDTSPTWPLQIQGVGGLVVTAVLPLISGLTPIVPSIDLKAILQFVTGLKG